MVAEAIIFGDNKITRGSEEDIERATNGNKSDKELWNGEYSAVIHVADYNTEYDLLDNDGTYNKEVKGLLEEAYTVAEKSSYQKNITASISRLFK